MGSHYQRNHRPIGELASDSARKRWRSLVSAGQSWAALANFTQKSSDADSVTAVLASEGTLIEEARARVANGRERGRVLGWRLTST